eukprot:TRINITY_DN3924_c0_g1_i1.p1 TRINITY_DN3924_c0_g1~~TRINITY_DN3924_c0_g1_i1.p1  ORF type:complete len:389 (-),score=42.85 TRINITY_DN3924_c0_g1_i1:94-1260(-)
MASSALLLGARMLDQVQNVGQIGELVQGHVHQREQIHWVRRAYQLDCQSIRLDVFDHAKDEIRSHHDTYMGRIDTLLLVLALIWPFALNTIQFSDPFVPHLAEDCEDCIEVEHTSLIVSWIVLLGGILILPFWGILMLIRCKLKLDRWLEYSLARLNHARRDMNIVPAPKPQVHGSSQQEHDDFKDDTKDIVSTLVKLVSECQEYLALIWTEECGWLVHTATSLLWVSATAALLLTALSMWIFLVNKGGMHPHCARLFAVIVLVGVAVPLIYVLWQRSWDELEPPAGLGEELSLARSVASAKGFEGREERIKHVANLRKSRYHSSVGFIDECDQCAHSHSRSPSSSDADLRISSPNVSEHGQPRKGWLCARRQPSEKQTLLSPLVEKL